MIQYPYRTWAMGPCWYCGADTFRMGGNTEHPQKYTRDHLIPRFLRKTLPGNTRQVTVTCCYHCNIRKAAKTAFQFLAKNKSFPEKKWEIIHRAYSVLKIEGGTHSGGIHG